MISEFWTTDAVRALCLSLSVFVLDPTTSFWLVPRERRDRCTSAQRRLPYVAAARRDRTQISFTRRLRSFAPTGHPRHTTERAIALPPLAAAPLVSKMHFPRPPHLPSQFPSSGCDTSRRPGFSSTSSDVACAFASLLDGNGGRARRPGPHLPHLRREFLVGHARVRRRDRAVDIVPAPPPRQRAAARPRELPAA